MSERMVDHEYRVVYHAMQFDITAINQELRILRAKREEALVAWSKRESGLLKFREGLEKAVSGMSDAFPALKQGRKV